MTIRTTHVGSLPRTPELLEANRARREGSLGEADFTSLLQDQVDGVVKRQAEIGLDIVNDGEYGHAMIDTVDYGAWWTYSFSRFGGLSFEDVQRFDVRPPAGRDGRLSFSSFAERRDWQRFADAYADPDSGIHIANRNPIAFPTITGELTYIGAEAVERDIAGTKHALEAVSKPCQMVSWRQFRRVRRPVWLTRSTRTTRPWCGRARTCCARSTSALRTRA